MADGVGADPKYFLSQLLTFLSECDEREMGRSALRDVATSGRR